MLFFVLWVFVLVCVDVCVCPQGSICLTWTFDCLVINVSIDLDLESLQADPVLGFA